MRVAEAADGNALFNVKPASLSCKCHPVGPKLRTNL